ncbi:MAG TPA: hypothetical protein VMV92_34045 [Streptosporangiaceae bacterium]|nr:hypothetical protein [Streptosporangiaceae bacterium]
MAEQTAGDGIRDDLEHDRGALLARRATRRQLDAIAAQCPGHQITVEIYPGRKDRYVAQAVTASAKPYLLITTDLNELSAELSGPGEHPGVVPPLPRRTPGTRNEPL